MNAIAPSNYRESQRLSALDGYAILDTPREQDFDDVASLASEICGTPIAVVNLIGEGRQFFKAEVGLGVRETPLESSFCAKAILEEDFLLVPDATKDVRFDCNPLVTGDPGLRFYAGALLKTEDGYPIGTVCVLDFVPRQLDELQQRTLRVLARQVMKQLDLRRTLRERDQAEAARTMLTEELSHRLKNTLAMVQAIVSQTMRDGTSMEDARATLTGRLYALSGANDILLQADWREADLRSLVEAATTLLAPAPGLIRANGPPVPLGPKAALGFALALHELGTNALKYGALSVPGGYVELSWALTDGPDSQFSFDWREFGGPSVATPKRKGFGSKLLERALAQGLGAKVSLEYASTGVAMSMTGPAVSLNE